MPNISMAQARERVSAALQRAGARVAMADATARALVLAEAQGLSSHGLSRVAQYSGHLRHGRVDGAAVAAVVKSRGAAAVVSRHGRLDAADRRGLQRQGRDAGAAD